MSETIKLRVPPEPAAEYVSQGNFGVELKPNSVVETKKREIADWLVAEYGLTEIVKKSAAKTVSEPETSDFPEDFPKREIFIEREIPFETARALTREQLTSIDGIAARTADRILAWQPGDNGAGEIAENAAENAGGEN